MQLLLAADLFKLTAVDNKTGRSEQTSIDGGDSAETVTAKVKFFSRRSGVIGPRVGGACYCPRAKNSIKFLDQ